MRYYFDTSALIKRYIKESGSEVIDDAIDKAKEILVSALTHIEAISSLRRLLSEEKICKADYEKIKIELAKDFKDFTILPILQETLNKAFQIVDSENLRTLDAIQLATVIIASEKIDKLVAADQHLLSAANNNNIITLDPLN